MKETGLHKNPKSNFCDLNLIFLVEIYKYYLPNNICETLSRDEKPGLLCHTADFGL